MTSGVIMIHWRYRAYDHQYRFSEGLSQAANFPELALILRQKGLQIVSAQSISKNDYQAELRLKKWKGVDDTMSPPVIRTTWLYRVWRWLKLR
jgi:hypothetical protein